MQPECARSILPLPTVNSHILAGIRTIEPITKPLTAIIGKQLLSSAINSMAITCGRVKTATASDPNIEKLISTTTTGFPELRHQLPPDLQEFYQFREHLYTGRQRHLIQRPCRHTAITPKSNFIHPLFRPPRNHSHRSLLQLTHCLRHFVTFGIPDELATDGGS